MPSRNEYDKMSSATPNPDSELRQKLIAIEFKTMKEFNRPDYKNIVWRLGEDGIDQILEVLQPYLAARDRRLELDIRLNELEHTLPFGKNSELYQKRAKELTASLGSTERREGEDNA